MAASLNLYEAKTQLSSLVERAASGERILICKSGKPKARLVPIDDPTDGAASSKRRLGFLAGCLALEPGWEAPLDPDDFKLLGPEGDDRVE